jgi:hypothetical protein
VTQLNQILAVEKGVKTRVDRAVTDAYHQLQKAPLLSGIARTYQPRDDEGERLPSEATKVQIKADTVLDGIADHLTRLIDVVATKDAANCRARGEVVVDGRMLLANVPVTTLLFLEKKLTDIATIIGKLPVLDPSETWTFDQAANCWATEPVQTVRTKKVPRNHVLAEATDRHPAQVQMYTEDTVAGYWTTVKFSGALPATRVAQLARRVDKLREAVQVAREQANSAEVTDVEHGAVIFDYLFAE